MLHENVEVNNVEGGFAGHFLVVTTYTRHCVPHVPRYSLFFNTLLPSLQAVYLIIIHTMMIGAALLG